MMKPRLERSEQACGTHLSLGCTSGAHPDLHPQAVAAFERTRKCESLPASEYENVDQAIARAKYRLKEGQDALDMPDMSNCVIA